MECLKGLPVSPGYAMGEVIELNRYSPGLNRMVLSPKKELFLFREAREVARKEFIVLRLNAHPSEKDIFSFQEMILDDEGFEQEVLRYIKAGGGAAAAVERAAKIFEKQIEAIEDSYLSQRSVDIRDACRRLVDILDGRTEHRFIMKKNGILSTDELYPSDLATINKTLLMGFITEKGTAESHAAIMANTLELPAIIHVEAGFTRRAVGKTVAMNGHTGEIFLEPDAATREFFEEILKK